MSVVDRVRNILVTPKTEWPVIAAEPATIGSIFKNYVLIVALLPPVGALLGGLLFSGGMMIVLPIVSYAVGLAVLYVVALIADALAPGFDGRKDSVSAMKLVAYAATPQWIAGFFAFIPGLNMIVGLLGFAYAAYLLYLGSMATMRVPENKAPAYTIVLILIWIVLGMFVAGSIVAAVTLSMLGGAAISSAYGV
jgi:hypothetical protein